MNQKIIPGSADLRDALWVREQVFTIEQGFVNPDFDEYDPISTHVVLYDQAQPVATGRIYEESAGLFHVGRIAVLKSHRKQTLGKQVMNALEEIARSKDAQELVLSAQLHALPFYERCGYQRTGDQQMDEHVLHELMKKSLR